jgi:hypothetical protein
MFEKSQLERLYFDKKCTVEEIAKELGISFWALYNMMKKHNISLRDRSEAGLNFNRLKPQFEVKSGLSISEEKLKIAGIMLYWAEGTLRNTTVDFANSNPEMIKIFLRFLRIICGIKEERLRVYLYAYSHHNLEQLKSYWHNTTGIPLSQFTKPYIREGNLNLSNRKLPFGLVHIRYNDKKLLDTIKFWIDEYVSSNWAGTQVAKGGRLCKRSVVPKGAMEK